MIRNEGRHLEFGKGDIGKYMGDASDVALLVFRNLKKPAPIGRLQNIEKAREVQWLNSDVVMSFSNTESIDTLKKCLHHVRNRAFTGQ